MSGGRRHTLNWEADARPGDPTAVSDPACWVQGPNADAIQNRLISSIGMLRHAPTYREELGVLDLSDIVIVSDEGGLSI